MRCRAVSANGASVQAPAGVPTQAVEPVRVGARVRRRRPTARMRSPQGSRARGRPAVAADRLRRPGSRHRWTTRRRVSGRCDRPRPPRTPRRSRGPSRGGPRGRPGLARRAAIRRPWQEWTGLSPAAETARPRGSERRDAGRDGRSAEAAADGDGEPDDVGPGVEHACDQPARSCRRGSSTLRTDRELTGLGRPAGAGLSTVPGRRQRRRFMSARISRAAFWPGWPVIPPPGWAPDAAQVEPVDRQAVAAAAEERPPQEELVEGLLAVERMAAGQAVVALEVERRDHLAGADRSTRARARGRRAPPTTRSPNASARPASSQVAVAQRGTARTGR